MDIEVVRSLPEDKWRHFVSTHPNSNIFHTSEMFQVFARTKGYHPELWAAICHGQLQALLLPVRITLTDGIFQRLTTRSVVYGGPLYASSPEGRQALELLLRIYRKERRHDTLFTELRNLCSTEDVQDVLSRQGYRYLEHLNYLIDLQRSEEEVLTSIGPRTRKHIRRGLRRGEVVVEEIRSKEQIATFYELLHLTYKAARVPLADQSLFDMAYDLLYPKGMIRITYASVEETIAAVSLELLYKDVMYGWYGGMNRKYSSYMPNELLMWHLLQWGIGNRYRTYDFGGAGTPSEEYGVRDFKAKFGGRLVSFGRNTCVHAPLILKISKVGYVFWRRLLS
jgi:hypothetical protein